MRVTILTLLISMLAAQMAICAPVNLVKNPGFEAGADAHGLPAGWWLWEQEKGLAKCAVDTAVRHSGARSFRVTLATSGYATLVAPDVPVAAGETLDVSVWVRAKDFVAENASSTITVNAAFRRSDGKFMRFVKFGKPVAEGAWHQFSAEATVPAGISTITAEVGIRNASGTVWFDDVCVTARSQYAIRPASASNEIPMGKSTWPIEIINRTGGKRQAVLRTALGSTSLEQEVRLDGSNLQKVDVPRPPTHSTSHRPQLDGSNLQKVDVPITASGPGKLKLSLRLSDKESGAALAEYSSEMRVLTAVELEPLVPTHFCIEDGRPTLEARVWNHMASGAAKEFTVTLADSKGAILDSKTVASPKPGWQDVTLSSDKAGLGEYSVEAKLTAADGKTYSASQPWHVINRAEARVTINEAGFPVADGKPIFPLGTFNSGRYELMSKTGFNTTHAWNRMYVAPEGARTDNQQALNYLNDTQRAGMKAIGFLHVAWMERQDFDGLRRRIRMFRNHPALLAWDSEEGVARGEVPFDRLEKLAKIVREHDPNHPFVLADSYDVINKVDRSRFFRDDLMDIGMWWYYPIPLNASAKESALLGRDADDGLTLNPPSYMTSTKKPVWVGMQAYVPDVAGGRLPSEAEFRCLAYIAIVNGAKGLLYYMGGSAGKMPGCAEDRPWGYLQTLVPELHSMIPTIMSSTAPEAVSITPSGNAVSTLLKREGGVYTLIAVNRSDKPVDVALASVCLGSREVEALFENRKLRSESGALHDHFEGYAAHVYRFGE